jgi:hypothetical protein
VITVEQVREALDGAFYVECATADDANILSAALATLEAAIAERDRIIEEFTRSADFGKAMGCDCGCVRVIASLRGDAE